VPVDGMNFSARQVSAARYIAPMREGGSLPALVEDDAQTVWITKFRGAAQGAAALVAEHIVAGLARALDLNIPHCAHIDVPRALSRTERDPDIKELLERSVGTNFALQYLEGAATFDPHADRIDPASASRILWLDAFTSNVDRTWRNANLLSWHGNIWLIDHGAAFFFHHGWKDKAVADVDRGAEFVKDHILLREATQFDEADAFCRARIDAQLCMEVTTGLPEEWMPESLRASHDADSWRLWYANYLQERSLRAQTFCDDVRMAYRTL